MLCIIAPLTAKLPPVKKATRTRGNLTFQTIAIETSEISKIVVCVILQKIILIISFGKIKTLPIPIPKIIIHIQKIIEKVILTFVFTIIKPKCNYEINN